MIVKSGNAKKGNQRECGKYFKKQTKRNKQMKNMGTGEWVPCVATYIFLASASFIRTGPSSMTPLATLNRIKMSFKFSCIQFINFIS